VANTSSVEKTMSAATLNCIECTQLTTSCKSRIKCASADVEPICCSIMLKVYSHVKPSEVTDGQRTPMIFKLCFLCQTILPEPISQGKNSYSDMASNIAKLKECGKLSGHFCRYV